MEWGGALIGSDRHSDRGRSRPGLWAGEHTYSVAARWVMRKPRAARCVPKLAQGGRS